MARAERLTGYCPSSAMSNVRALRWEDIDEERASSTFAGERGCGRYQSAPDTSTRNSSAQRSSDEMLRKWSRARS
jgi:hypothetical protein